MTSRASLLLSDRFLGYYLVPDAQVWNYNFQAIKWTKTMQYSLHLANPRAFYAQQHRPNHFRQFAQLESLQPQQNGNKDEQQQQLQQLQELQGADKEDVFA
jgi:pre-mRNA-processing factor 8